MESSSRKHAENKCAQPPHAGDKKEPLSSAQVQAPSTLPADVIPANSEGITEEERKQVRHRTNARIAHACCYAALIVILIDLAAYVIGQADWFFTPVGIMLSIALLAIAQLNNPTDFGSKK